MNRYEFTQHGRHTHECSRWLSSYDKALRTGSVDAITDSPTAAALVIYLFVELDPKLIVLCAYEAGTDVAHANLLYQEGQRNLMPRVHAWEKSIKYML